MIPASVLKELSDIVGPKYFTTQHDELSRYASDATKLEFMPDAVAFPGNSEEISRILHLANREYFPVIPRGAGTGASGGVLPVMAGLVLAMDRFNKIIAIDQDNLIVKVEPGVITGQLQEEVEKVDLFYPPDPASTNISTIGGNVAECAGGLRAVKYGVTRDYVLGLTVVLPTGETIKTGVKTTKGVVGYDLTRLIVGSEGTLAVITSIILRLIPKPAFKKTMMAFFRNVSLAMQAVSDIIRTKIVPSTLEFMDRLCIDCVRDEMNISIPGEAKALLLIEVDGDEVVVSREAEKVQGVCGRTGVIDFKAASGTVEAERLWEARRNVSRSLLRLRPDKLSQDIVVPRSRMAEVVLFLGQLGRKYNLPIPAFGHAGDGNIHVNIMLDKNVPREVEDANVVVRELFRKVLEMEGTISGEHGIGITKAPYIEMEISRPAIELMSRLKKTFDPMGILNPGKIFS
ncbi:MAG: FAD-linked oxidase C-terminal domain-containing protein [Thermodesulfobacteriota bacterium]|nr:FAD-linked oxidase C-terminal domain-containing protein [Thermodesulfobacteriota bacterium]